MKSILQDWVMELPIRYQGTLLTAMRGCDGVPREDTTKIIMRGLRNTTLNPADARELAYKGGFMSFDLKELTPSVKQFAKNSDQYPLHFVMHLMHALEVIGYTHPDHYIRDEFCAAYRVIVSSLHLNPETGDGLYKRMLEDRIQTGNI